MTAGGGASCAAEFGGTYSLYHDGWYGWLELRHESGPFLRGRYVDIRFDRTYNVTATVDAASSGHIELALHRFNHLATQVFQGWPCGPIGDAFAGITWWHDTPFGFFVRRGGFLHLSDYGDGTDRVTPSAFVGRYTVWNGQGMRTVEFSPAVGNRLLGRYTEPAAPSQDFVVSVGNGHAHQIAFSFQIAGEPAAFTGYLFKRPKNAIAGHLEWDGHKTGMFMTKYCSDAR